jgi:trigger factor
VKVSTERIPDAQVVMTIEVEPERLDAARDKAVRKLAPKAKVPGFRPGKAPAPMIRRYFGEDRVLDEALDILVPAVYREAVEADDSIVPIARPRLEIEQVEPLVVKATIPVRPTIELGDYQSVRVPIEDVTVDEARVDDTIRILRRRAATLEPHDRAIGWRDVIHIDVKATVAPALTDLQATGPETMIDQQDIEIQPDEDHEVSLPGFEEALLGHRKGERVEFDLEVPDAVEYDKFRGKKAHFVVDINETKAELLPEVDDDFLKGLGEGFESEQALRDRILADIRKTEEEQRDNRYHDAILGQLVERATIEFPPVMLEAEIDRVFHDNVGHFDSEEDFERYLATIGKTPEQVREEILPAADVRLRRSLVLTRVAEAEKIEATGEEVTAEIDRMATAAGPRSGQLRQVFESDNGRETIARNLVTRKTLARLVEIATQDAAAATPTAAHEKPIAETADNDEDTAPEAPEEATE